MPLKERWIPNEKTLHYNQTCQRAECPCIPQLNIESQFLYLNGKSLRVCVCMCVCICVCLWAEAAGVHQFYNLCLLQSFTENLL